MPSIEDFAQDLFKDAKEIFVPKEKVTELSPGWYVSKYNFPHKGALKSWRNGRFHAFDMGDHYAVHLDRIDPRDHGIGHLIEDAPFVLFLWDEFRDASKSIGEAKREDLDPQDIRWVPHIIIGIVLLLVGTFIVLNNSLALEIVYRAMALGLLAIGSVLFVKGLITRVGRTGRANIIAGLAAMIMSVAIFFVPGIAFWLLLLVLATWTLGSGIFLVFGRGDKLLFNSGSIAPLVIGMSSLALATTIFLNPVSGLTAVMLLAGFLMAFIGASQFVVGAIHGRFLVFGPRDRT